MNARVHEARRSAEQGRPYQTGWLSHSSVLGPPLLLLWLAGWLARATLVWCSAGPLIDRWPLLVTVLD